MYVHSVCRKYFTDQRKIKRHKPEDAAALSQGLRLKGILYWKHVLEIRDSLLWCCAEHADEWGLQVSGWLQSRNDLVAEEACITTICTSASLSIEIWC